MSDQTVQPINAIGDAKQEVKEPTDPIQEEFDAGKGFLAKDEIGQAAVAFHNVLKAHEEKEDQNGIANACNQLGNVCLAREDFDGALNFYQRAWDIVEAEDDPMSMLVLQTQQIKAYQGLKDYPKALDLCLEMVDSYNKDNNPQGTVDILEVMAVIYQESGDVAKAADTLRTIGSIHSHFKHKNIAESYNQKASDLEATV
ncbi:MAG: tetratricopeptide repeat protein [Thermodesulfobacteriota bacterium]